MFRRSGSLVAFYVDGKMPAVQSEAFLEALANERFRTIEDAASEEQSIGWVSPGDPTGQTFELDEMDLDQGLWLRFRVDKKKLPAIWLSIHRSEAERSAGRKLSARERKDLKEDLMQRMLPRILPSVGLVDVLFAPDSGRVLLFASSTAMKEEFQKLWFRSFATNLVEADAFAAAARSGLGRDQLGYLEEVSPVRWGRNGGRPTEAPRPERLAPEPEPEPEPFTAGSDGDDHGGDSDADDRDDAALAAADGMTAEATE